MNSLVRGDPPRILDDVPRSSPPTWVPRLHRMRYEPDPGDDPVPTTAADVGIGQPVALGHTPTAVLHAQLREILRIALEVYDGRRSPTQLTAAFAPSALRYWRSAPAVHPRTPTPPRLGRTRMGRPHAHVAEMVAVVNLGGRYRALPARFERGADRVWRCTDIRLL